MMFRLIVRYLGFLKHVPFLAWFVDAMIMIWNSAVRPGIQTSIERIEEEVMAWDGLTRTLHKFGGLQFNYGDKEIGHIHSNGNLDILFNRKTKRFLLEAGLASDHHAFPHSGWISFYVSSEKDVQMAIVLLALAYKRNADKLETYSLP